MKKILVLTNILPVSTISRKKNENNILLETEDQILSFKSGLKFTYIFSLPRTFSFLTLFKKRWKEYNTLQKAKFYNLKNRKIFVLGIIQLPFILSFRNILYDLSYWLDKEYIAEIIKKTRPEIIHAQDADFNAYLAKKIGKEYDIPYIVTLRYVNIVKDKLIQRNLNSAVKLIALSPTQVKDASRITHKKIDLVPHGIDANFFVKRDLKQAMTPLKFVVIARLLPLKNIDKVINALSVIDEDFIFDIYGDGQEFNRLQEIIEANGMESKVFLKGRVSNSKLPNILPNYDMFIMPSYPETLGRVYFEAMGCGLPVMATKNTGIDGIITDGIEGFLVQPTQESITECIMKIVNNPDILTKMGIMAHKTAKNYSWERISNKYYEIYFSV